jgi:hypothetical protein
MPLVSSIGEITDKIGLVPYEFFSCFFSPRGGTELSEKNLVKVLIPAYRLSPVLV